MVSVSADDPAAAVPRLPEGMMSTHRIVCPQCNAVIAEERPGLTGTPIGRGVDDVIYIPKRDERTVIIVCAACNTPVTWKGKRLIIVDAA